MRCVEGTGRDRILNDTAGMTRSSSCSFTIFNANHRRMPQTLKALRALESISQEHSLRQIVSPYVHDYHAAGLPDRYHSSMDSLATLAASPGSNVRFSPGSCIDLRSSVVVQMGDSRVPVSRTSQGSLPSADGLASLRVSLTFSDRRYPTFIPAHVPFPKPKGVLVPVVDSDVDHYDEEYESTAGRGLESSGSASTVKPAPVREDYPHYDSYSKCGGEGLSRHRGAARHGRQKSGEVQISKQAAHGVPRAFLAYGVDSEDEDVPLSYYSGGIAV